MNIICGWIDGRSGWMRTKGANVPNIRRVLVPTGGHGGGARPVRSGSTPG